MRFIERAPRVLPTPVTFHIVSNGADQNHNLSISIAQAWIPVAADSRYHYRGVTQFERRVTFAGGIIEDKGEKENARRQLPGDRVIMTLR